jgi:hypothetical protein
MLNALKYRATCLLDKFACLPFISRLLIKFGLFIIVGFIAHFPNASLFITQVSHFLKMEQLIQPDFPGIIEINNEIDKRLPQGAVRIDEFHIVENYVYEKIAYDFDWNIGAMSTIGLPLRRFGIRKEKTAMGKQS